MFRVQRHDEPMRWPVHVHVPRDGGLHDRQQFTAHFRLLDRQRLGRLAAQGDAELLREAWVGWGEDLRGEDGEPLPYADETREDLLRITYVLRAVTDAYYEFLAGAPRKNS